MDYYLTVKILKMAQLIAILNLSLKTGGCYHFLGNFSFIVPPILFP